MAAPSSLRLRLLPRAPSWRRPQLLPRRRPLRLRLPWRLQRHPLKRPVPQPRKLNLRLLPQHRRLVASSCRRPAPAPFIARRRRLRLLLPPVLTAHRAAFSVAGPFSIAAPLEAPEVPAVRAPAWVDPDRAPLVAGPCTLPVRSPEARVGPAVRVPAWVPVPVSASVPASAPVPAWEGPVLRRPLLPTRRVRSALVVLPAEAASNTPRPKKAP
jgi:hypothetical protein